MSVVLPLDLTGRAASNLVTDEVKTLNPTDKRVFVLEHGPFYTKGLVVTINNAAETVLQPNVDYKAVQLFPELTLRTGLEVCSAIVLLRSSGDIGDSFKVTAQMVGGDYSASASGLQTMLDAAYIDNSPVEWGQIYGKPALYPAGAHLQDIADAYGFEYVVNELEAIRQAVEYGDAAAREELEDYISGRFEAFQDELARMGNWVVEGDVNWGSARDEKSGLTIQWGRSALINVGSSQILHYHRVFTNRFYTMPTMEGKSVAVEGDWDLFAPFHAVVIGDQQAAVLPVGVTMPDTNHACFVALGRVKSSSGSQSYIGYTAMGLTDDSFNTTAPSNGRGSVVAQSYFAPSLSVSPATSNRNSTVEVTSGTYYSDYFTPSVNGGSGAYTYQWSISGTSGNVALDTSGNKARLKLTFSGLSAEGEQRSGSASLTCLVTDTVTGLTDSRTVTSALSITYHIPYADLSVVLSPSPLTNNRTVTTAAGTVVSDTIHATVTGGAGNYTYYWFYNGTPSATSAVTDGAIVGGAGGSNGGVDNSISATYTGLTTDGSYGEYVVPLALRVTDAGSGFTKTVTTTVTLRATRSVVYPTLVMTVTPGGTSQNTTVTTTSGTLYSEWFTQAATGGSGNYEDPVTWSLENVSGGGSLTLETQMYGNGPRARLVFNYSNLSTDGASVQASGRLRATVRDNVTGNTATNYGDYSFTATRSVTYPALGVSISPSSINSNLTVDTASGTIYGDVLTATATGGSGSYSYSWTTVNSTAITADSGFSSTGTQYRPKMAYSGLSTDGAFSANNATAVMVVTDTVTGLTAQATASIAMRATRSITYSDVTVSLSPTSVGGDRTVNGASGTVYSDWTAASASGGSGSYTYTWEIIGANGNVAIDSTGSSGRLKLNYSGLAANGANASGSATIRVTVTDATAGKTAQATATATVKATRMTSYGQLVVSLSPSNSTASVNAASSASTAAGNYVTPTVSGGSGSYAISWSISGNGTLDQSGNNARAVVNYDPNNLTVGANNFSGTLTCTVTDAMAGMQANASVPFSITINKAPPNSGSLGSGLDWNGMASGGNGGSGFSLSWKADGSFRYEGRVGGSIKSSKSGTWMTGGSSGDFEIYFTNISYQSISSGGADGDITNSDADIDVTPDTWLPLPLTVSIGPGGYSSMTSYDGDFDATIRDKNNHSNSVSFSISFHGTENCFAVGTLVRTEAGDLPIQTLAINTELESFTCDNMLDEDDPDWESWTSENPNIQQTSTFVRNIGVFKAQGGFVVNEFICTGGHVWFILRDGVYRWCRTRDLLPTDQLVSDDGPVDITTYFETAAEIQFVSMNVEDVDTYKVVDTHGRAYYTHNAFS